MLCIVHGAKFFMKLNSKLNASVNVVLSCDDSKRLAAFVEILLKVDRRVKAQAPAGKQKRTTKTKYEKKGSRIKSGPFLFYVRLLYGYAQIYMSMNYGQEYNCDRYYCFDIEQGYVPSQCP